MSVSAFLLLAEFQCFTSITMNICDCFVFVSNQVVRVQIFAAHPPLSNFLFALTFSFHENYLFKILFILPLIDCFDLFVLRRVENARWIRWTLSCFAYSTNILIICISVGKKQPNKTCTQQLVCVDSGLQCVLGTSTVLTPLPIGTRPMNAIQYPLMQYCE